MNEGHQIWSRAPAHSPAGCSKGYKDEHSSSPKFGNTCNSLCLWIAPLGTKKDVIAFVQCLAWGALGEGGSQWREVGGRAKSRLLRDWGREVEAPLWFGKASFSFEGQEKGRSVFELSYWDNYLPSRTIKIQRAIFVSLAAIHSWSRSNYKWIR